MREIRRAEDFYLLVAHVGAVGILLSFGVMAGVEGDYTFDAMRDFSSHGLADDCFPACLVRLRRQSRHPAIAHLVTRGPSGGPFPGLGDDERRYAETAIYGMLRVSFDLLHAQIWWWGVLLLLLGLATALFGVVFSLIQTDMKRLLAYSSIENIGLIFLGFGLTLIFKSFMLPHLAALALTATLYHCLNHAFFKSLLFLCTGSVLHATRERNLGKLGGLIHRMPWVTWLALICVLAASGLPPLNGFASEWLLLQSFLFTSGLPQGYLNMLLPVIAGAVALISAFAGFTMVKFFRHRFSLASRARKNSLRPMMPAALSASVCSGWAWGASCLACFPTSSLALLDPVTRLLVGSGLRGTAGSHGWWLLAPISQDRASYSPAIFLGSIVIFMPLVYWAVKRFYHGRLKRVPAWDCGFPLQTARMQDTAEGFGQPIRRIFSPFFKRTREHPSPFDSQPRYLSIVEDPFWYWADLPIAKIVERGTQLIAFLQQAHRLISALQLHHAALASGVSHAHEFLRPLRPAPGACHGTNPGADPQWLGESVPCLDAEPNGPTFAADLLHG